MHKIIVSGSGTDVGKTVVSAILTLLLDADYWKPIQCGNEEDSDTAVIKNWVDARKNFVHSPIYSFKAPVSPHHAARLENTSVELETITLPQTTRTLVIESVGGVFVPLTIKTLSIDLFQSWNCKWIIVSRHYVGSINHTLLTIEALQKRQIPILGIIFNGDPNPDSEAAILGISQLACLGRLLPEKKLNSLVFKRYATEWKPSFTKIFH